MGVSYAIRMKENRRLHSAASFIEDELFTKTKDNQIDHPISERICDADILFCRYNGSIIRNKCIDHKIQTGKIPSDLSSNLSCNVSISLHY